MTLKLNIEIDPKVIRKAAALMELDIPSDETISDWLSKEHTMLDGLKSDELDLVFAMIVLGGNIE